MAVYKKSISNFKKNDFLWYMYVPNEFKPNDASEVHEFLKANPFGILINNSDNQESVATHMPFLIKSNQDELILEGHIARANKHSELIRDARSTLVVFQGPHAYISSSVYSHENVPTWNYQAVHVYGTTSKMSDGELSKHLEEMVHHHESGREHRLDYSKLSEDMIAANQKEILGFKITAYRIEAAFKLSQNRNETDLGNIIEDLNSDEKNRPIVEAMDRSRKKD
ncbi:MAG: FMN-binding negative transcriptional regulator [Flavobacteriales bacterium]